MFDWLSKIFSRKLEVNIHVPEIRVIVTSSGGGISEAAVRQDTSKVRPEEGGCSLIAPAVSDEDRLSRLSEKLTKGDIKVPEVKFGQESESE